MRFCRYTFVQLVRLNPEATAVRALVKNYVCQNELEAMHMWYDDPEVQALEPSTELYGLPLTIVNTGEA